MTVFFTHIMTPAGLILDSEGQTFNDLGEACAATEDAARHLVASGFRHGKDRVVLEFRIEDNHGVRLATVPIEAEITGGICH